MERSNRTLNVMLIKKKGDMESSRVRLNNALLNLSFLNDNKTNSTVAERHWIFRKDC